MLQIQINNKIMKEILYSIVILIERIKVKQKN